VIAIDSRGQGRSTLAKGGKLSYHVMANDVLAVMDALNVAKAALVGWSDGGAIALDIAVHHPKRVDRLFVFGTNYHASGNKPRKKSTRTFTAYARKCKSDHAKLSKTPRAYDAAVAALLPIWRSTGGFSKEQLRRIAVPTVVADGEHDEIIRLDHIREMAQLIPNARLVVFDDTSHFALWQDPQAFNAALLAFLAAK
jgi:pimeloyl-ACP methyl ester carboxylesterase